MTLQNNVEKQLACGIGSVERFKKKIISITSSEPGNEGRQNEEVPSEEVLMGSDEYA